MRALGYIRRKEPLEPKKEQTTQEVKQETPVQEPVQDQGFDESVTIG
jgi:hypothetical protein